MKTLHIHLSTALTTPLLFFILLLSSPLAADASQSLIGELETSQNSESGRAAPTVTVPSTPARPKTTKAVPWNNSPETGDVNCHHDGAVGEEVNDDTCMKLAKFYDITIEKFFILNPQLDSDCANVRPFTKYCVDGFIEPLRAYDGLCGPQHENATCAGTRRACCNSETWTCGHTSKDCVRGTCYEGMCWGHKVFTTDGKCGAKHGNSYCAGKWGDCCNLDGQCGVSEDFCAAAVCQSGNCEARRDLAWHPPAGMLGLVGNTTDGSCGGENGFVCNSAYGDCCNKNGICGSTLTRDCGDGCQPKYGKCGNIYRNFDFACWWNGFVE